MHLTWVITALCFGAYAQIFVLSRHRLDLTRGCNIYFPSRATPLIPMTKNLLKATDVSSAKRPHNLRQQPQRVTRTPPSICSLCCTCSTQGTLYRTSENATTEALTALPEPGEVGSLSQNEVRSWIAGGCVDVLVVRGVWRHDPVKVRYLYWRYSFSVGRKMSARNGGV